jgi:hypothetical protein
MIYSCWATKLTCLKLSPQPIARASVFSLDSTRLEPSRTRRSAARVRARRRETLRTRDFFPPSYRAAQQLSGHRQHRSKLAGQNGAQTYRSSSPPPQVTAHIILLLAIVAAISSGCSEDGSIPARGRGWGWRRGDGWDSSTRWNLGSCASN